MYKKNDLIDVTIVDFTNEGEGVGKADGFPFFVKDTVIGDEVIIKITKLKKNYGYGRLEKVIKPSENRIVSPCQESRRCGGCQIQSMSYEAQLKYKEAKVFNNLQRLGGIDKEILNTVFEPIIGMEEPFRYRNKAQYPIGVDKEGNIICGFYAGRTHSIISNMDCLLGGTENAVILNRILEWMKKYSIIPYDEATGVGLVRHVLIRKGYYSNQIMVCLVVNGDNIPHADKLVDMLIEIDGMTAISYSINKDRTNVIMGKDYSVLWGSSTIEDTLLGLKFRISPLSFYQVNPIQVEKLYKTAIEYANLTGCEEVWDLCCGIGTITLAMASLASRVHGIEIVPQAIEDAKNNAVANCINNAEFICAPVEEYMPEHADSIQADVIIMDPPRKGMDEKALEVTVMANPSRIVYVSCDSATLARDVRYLCEHGYKLEKVRPVDMFPQTIHVEAVCLLSKLREAKHHVSVTLDMDEMDLTSAESKATYEEIKKYVAEHNDGMKVSSLNIAQVKRKCGIELAENYNLPKSEDSRQPQCPKEKEDAIMEALKLFKMI